MPHQLELVYDLPDGVWDSDVYHAVSSATYESRDELPFDPEVGENGVVADTDVLNLSMERAGTVPHGGFEVEIICGVTKTDGGHIQINVGSDAALDGVEPLPTDVVEVIHKVVGDRLSGIAEYEEIAIHRHGE